MLPETNSKRKRGGGGGRVGNRSMPLHKLSLIMAFNVQENTVFTHEFSKISLPWEGDLPWTEGIPPHTPSPRLVASLPLVRI